MTGLSASIYSHMYLAPWGEKDSHPQPLTDGLIIPGCSDSRDPRCGTARAKLGSTSAAGHLDLSSQPNPAIPRSGGRCSASTLPHLLAVGSYTQGSCFLPAVVYLDDPTLICFFFLTLLLTKACSLWRHFIDLWRSCCECTHIPYTTTLYNEKMEERRLYEEQALLGRERNGSWSSSDDSHTAASDVELDDLEEASFRAYTSSVRPKWLRRSRTNSKVIKLPTLQQRHEQFPRTRRKRSRYHRLWRLTLHLPYFLIALLIVTGVFFPSYSNPPQRYDDLRRRVLGSTREGAANPHNEKVFIAASLYDKNGGLLRGDWGRSVLHLIDMLGHDNVFVSIYENDPSEAAMLAMADFRERLPCESSIVHEELDTSELDHVLTTDGTHKLKRMSFLADVRNRALRPLEDGTSTAYQTNWDKLLYLNDVVFDPVDAANLLLNTNVHERTGRTDYRAACSVDFINPFKFYDTFATRDAEGYDMGVPFYPWFTNAGEGRSRRDVLEQKDAVRVKSCWGGMVAFEANWFRSAKQLAEKGKATAPSSTTMDSDEVSTKEEPMYPADSQITTSAHNILTRSPADNTTTSPLRFRSQPETFWEASECCLIHADLASAASRTPNQPAIYLNPYIRVAYSRSTLRWLGLARRFERLYPHIHTLINWIGKRPGFNERQFEREGEEVGHWVWRWDEPRAGNGTDVQLTGRYVRETVMAQAGGFCGTRKLQVMREGESKRKGGKNWGSEVVPAVPAKEA